MDALFSVMLFSAILTNSYGSLEQTFCTQCPCQIPITAHQRYAIQKFKSGLASNSSSSYVNELVYNTTEPIINLTDDQEAKLLAKYPTYFTVANVSDWYMNGSMNGTSEKYNDGSLLRRKRREVVRPRICASHRYIYSYSLGYEFDLTDEVVAIIAQGRIIQLFEEDVCIKSHCTDIPGCQCYNEERAAHAIIITEKGFIPSTIRLRACIERASPVP